MDLLHTPIKTQRLTIRLVEPSDWKAMQRIWNAIKDTPFAQYDSPHPTDDETLIAKITVAAAARQIRITQIVKSTVTRCWIFLPIFRNIRKSSFYFAGPSPAAHKISSAAIIITQRSNQESILSKPKKILTKSNFFVPLSFRQSAAVLFYHPRPKYARAASRFPPCTVAQSKV